MRIVTWNVQGMAPRWRERRGALVGALESVRPDVVALQECAWRLRHQSTQLAAPLDMRASRAGTLGMLTREPAREVRALPLPARAKGGSKRVLTATAGGVSIWVVHLPLDAAVRRACAAAFAEWAAAAARPVVLCGDFNERPDAGALTELRERGFSDAWTAGNGHTWPANQPEARIDFVLTYGDVSASASQVLRPDRPASDHLGLMVDLR